MIQNTTFIHSDFGDAKEDKPRETKQKYEELEIEHRQKKLKVSLWIQTEYYKDIGIIS